MASFKETTDDNGFRSVVVYLNGNLLGADQNNYHYDEIIRRLGSHETDGLEDLFSPENAIREQFKQLSADVRVENGVVYYRDELVNSNLSHHLIKLWKAKEDFKPVLKFLERLYQNPQPESRDMLWDWIRDRNLILCKNGMVIGWKGVSADFSSTRTGVGDLVNGEPVSKVFNNPGNVVEKPRSQVTFDPSLTCAQGLHIGTYSFARDFIGFLGKVVEVLFSPADVVSVTSDAEGQKIRVCKYKVLREVTEERKDLVDHEDYKFDGGVVTNGDPKRQATAVIEALEAYKKKGSSKSVSWGVLTKDDIRLGGSPSGDPIKDTTKNHLTQKRGPDGRFLKKGK